MAKKAGQDVRKKRAPGDDERFFNAAPVSGRYLILARMPLPPERWAESEGFYHEIELPRGGDRWLMAVRGGVLMIRVETKNPQRALKAVLRHKEYNSAPEVDCTLVPPREECSPLGPPPALKFRLEDGLAPSVGIPGRPPLAGGDSVRRRLRGGGGW